jgi:hypothetical protein
MFLAQVGTDLKTDPGNGNKDMAVRFSLRKKLDGRSRWDGGPIRPLQMMMKTACAAKSMRLKMTPKLKMMLS